MTNTLTINIMGTPISQGSKGARIQGRRAVLFDTNADKLKPWRKTITTAAEDAIRNHYSPNNHRGWEPLDTPAELVVTFYQPRPRSHYGTGRNAQTLRLDAPTWCSSKPDVDKLLRALLDGLTDAGAVTDDSRVVRIIAEHRYATPTPGIRLHLTPIPTTTPGDH